MLRKLEKYEIIEELGHGGMATVYRATDTVLEREVALKVMHPHLRAAEEARRRFHREARSVARLRHPRVLEIYDFSGEGSEEAYIAAELLTGPTLKQWREQQGEVPAEIAACATIEIAQALEAAHAAGIVHRDVKPENVLLHENRELKLTDFGIADMLDAQSMTATGQILGSPGHMAPEQIEGKDCDARTDLFSLGTVIYYLATGRLPFTGRNPHQVLKRIIDGEYADPLRVNPTIGGRLRAIIVKALERDVAERYQSAREVIVDLEAFVAEAGITDAQAMLERYLKDPEKVGAEIRAETIDRLIEHGARASDAGDVPGALDYYNRVLALDEGNERVLKLIERVGMDRRRRMLLMAGAGLMAFGALTTVSAWALWPSGAADDERPIVGPIDAPLSDAGTGDARSVDSGSADSDGADSGGGDAAAAALATSNGGRDAGSPAVAPPRRDAGRVRHVVSHAPRLVRFIPTPSNVLIGVDGRPPVPWGQLTTTELTPGRHRVRLIPRSEIATTYQETALVIVVEPGDGEQPVELALEPAPAVILVDSRVPGEVIVARGRRRGRTGTAIVVPMRMPRENLHIEVRAPGHQTYGEMFQLSAGAPTLEIPVTLVPVAPAP